MTSQREGGAGIIFSKFCLETVGRRERVREYVYIDRRPDPQARQLTQHNPPREREGRSVVGTCGRYGLREVALMFERMADGSTPLF